MGRERRPRGPQLEGSPGAGPRQGAGGAAGPLGTCPPRALQTARVRVSFLPKWWTEHGSHILFRGSYAGPAAPHYSGKLGAPGCLRPRSAAHCLNQSCRQQSSRGLPCPSPACEVPSPPPGPLGPPLPSGRGVGARVLSGICVSQGSPEKQDPAGAGCAHGGVG